MKKIIISVILFFLLVTSVFALWDNILITRRINITTNVTNVSNTYYNYTNNYNQSLNTSDSVMFKNINATNNLIVMNRVGIGTTAPLAKLHIVGQTAFQDIYGNTPTYVGIVSMEDDFKIDAKYSGTDILFLTATGEKVRIQQNGNVGIGTINPQQKLHVNGNILTNGTFIVNGSSGINGTYTILKDVDLVGLTKTYCNMTYVGGLLTGSNC